MDLHASLSQLFADDRTSRSEAIRTIVLADKAAYDDQVIAALVHALDHNDYEIQEWATVALRKLKGDQRVSRALWRCFETETRHSARSCALIALGRLGECLSPTALLTLYNERKDHPKDLVLESAIRWAGPNAPKAEMLVALRNLQEAEAQRVRREPRLQVTIATALLRAAKRALIARTVSKAWLKEHGFQDLLDKLRETRIERLIAEERARLAQPALALGLDAPADEAPLVPGRPLEDVALEQYAQDRAVMLNERISEQRTYVRDRHLAVEAKRKAGYRCQACGEALDDPTKASRFVQAHHVAPVSEMGADIAENIVVLCPNCHAKIHAGSLHVESDGGAVRVAGARVATTASPAASPAEPSVVERICALFQQLAPAAQEAVVQELLTTVAKREANDASE